MCPAPNFSGGTRKGGEGILSFNTFVPLQVSARNVAFANIFNGSCWRKNVTNLRLNSTDSRSILHGDYIDESDRMHTTSLVGDIPL